MLPKYIQETFYSLEDVLAFYRERRRYYEILRFDQQREDYHLILKLRKFWEEMGRRR